MPASASTADDVLLTDLDGRPLTREALVTLLQHHTTTADTLRRRSVDIVGVEIEPDSERRWPQSHSAQLRLALAGEPAMRVFLKKAVASSGPPKPLAALQRDLRSNRCEALSLIHISEPTRPY